MAEKLALLNASDAAYVERYKGVLLIGSKYADAENTLFFETVKKAIDMAVELPVALRRYTELIDKIAYDPPSKRRTVKGALNYADAAYTITDLRRKGPLIFYRNMRNSSSLEVSMSLVGGGVLAARHLRLIDLIAISHRSEAGKKDDSDKARQGIEKEIADRMILVRQADKTLVDQAECDLQFVFMQAERAFGVRKSKISRRMRVLDQRNCWAPRPAGR